MAEMGRGVDEGGFGRRGLRDTTDFMDIVPARRRDSGLNISMIAGVFGAVVLCGADYTIAFNATSEVITRAAGTRSGLASAPSGQQMTLMAAE